MKSNYNTMVRVVDLVCGNKISLTNNEINRERVRERDSERDRERKW